jgi:hypothetical protein
MSSPAEGGSAPVVRSLLPVAGDGTGVDEQGRMPLEQELRLAEKRNRMLVEQLPQVTYI